MYAHDPDYSTKQARNIQKNKYLKNVNTFIDWVFPKPQSKIHINMLMFTLDMISCRKKVIVRIIKSKINPKKKSKALNATATGIIRGPKKIYESMAIF